MAIGVPRGDTCFLRDIGRTSQFALEGPAMCPPMMRNAASVCRARAGGEATSTAARRIIYNGMLPCFLGGLRSRLVSSAPSAAISLARVCRGKMTSSMKPRSAATYGLANFS